MTDNRQHDSALGRWTLVARPSHPRLRAYVRGFIASDSVLPRPIRERLLPSAEVPMVLNFGAAHHRFEEGGSERRTTLDGGWIVGLHDHPQRSEAVGEREFMIVRFTPFGAHSFLRTPMLELRGRATGLDTIDPSLVRLVMGRVGAARGWAERFNVMERLIADRVERTPIPASVNLAWNRLEATDGRVPLRVVATEIDHSHRTLIALFKTHVGVTPKTASRIFRFGRTIRSLEGVGGHISGRPYIELESAATRDAPRVLWAELAADCGYFDQSHLIREFRQFSGVTPTAFLRALSDID